MKNLLMNYTLIETGALEAWECTCSNGNMPKASLYPTLATPPRRPSSGSVRQLNMIFFRLIYIHRGRARATLGRLIDRQRGRIPLSSTIQRQPLPRFYVQKINKTIKQMPLRGIIASLKIINEIFLGFLNLKLHSRIGNWCLNRHSRFSFIYFF